MPLMSYNITTTSRYSSLNCTNPCNINSQSANRAMLIESVTFNYDFLRNTANQSVMRSWPNDKSASLILLDRRDLG